MSILYIHLHTKVELKKHQAIHLDDIAFITTSDKNLKLNKIKREVLYTIQKRDEDYLVIDGFQIIQHLTNSYDDFEIQMMGAEQVIIEVIAKKKRTSYTAFAFVWLILFVGASMTIMNFHEDVGMQAVHEKIHYIITGNQSKHPLWLQIPYSLGLGAGMLLFFNHWFKKKFNEEPSPLEVEMFKYQKDLNQYLKYHENAMYDKKHT